MERGTQSEKARRDGVHRSTVSRRVRKGKEDVGGVSNEIRDRKDTERMRKQMGGQ